MAGVRSTRTVAFLRKFWALVAIYWQDTMAYRATAFIWILADSQGILIMPAVWLAAYAGQATMFGMTPDTMIMYYLVTLVISQFVVCHLMWDIAFEIREGIFSVHLLRPASIFWMMSARNVSWRIAKLLFAMPLIAFFALVYGAHVSGVPLHITPAFLACVMFAHVLSFVIAYSLAMVALWTTEFMSIFRVYYFPEVFLSGRLVPLEAMPPWVGFIANAMPFKYTVSVPANMALGRIPSDALPGILLIQAAWIAAFLLLGRVLLERGRRAYTGFGN